MSDKLTEIMAWKRVEIAGQVRPVPLAELAALHASLPAVPSFAASLRRSDGKLAVIAEIKRRSPSAGAIATGVAAPAQAERYRHAAASALSVLTDEKYFGGTLDDLSAVTVHFRQSSPPLPCIRKDFFVHPIQVLQARQAGASAILIIVRALTDAEIAALGGATAAGIPAAVSSGLKLNAISASGANVVITWAGAAGVKLQSSATLGGVWADVTGSDGASVVSQLSLS
jgi:indole-3-glycerol phosphate synthase